MNPRTCPSCIAAVLISGMCMSVGFADTGLIPLTDMPIGQTYQGFPGKLYPSDRNYDSGPHLADGLKIGQLIRPLGASGQPDPNGRIVLLSIGMSNTSQESQAFSQALQSFTDRHPALRFVNGAQGGQTAAIISDPNAQFWVNVDQRLAQNGLTPQQVQVVWYKEANAGPSGSDIAYAQTLQQQSETIMGIIKSRYPNTRQAFVSSRIYAGYATTGLNPEPYAYASGFSMKWLIEAQINGDPDLNYRPFAGPVRAPWIGWGAYLWADGLTPRSDGLTWLRSDLATDGTHPSSQGAAKAAGLLLDRFSTDPTSRLWFLRPQLAVLLGDMTGDGSINAFDVQGFVLAISDPAAFEQQYPDVDRVQAGDVNQDGSMNTFDINGFVELLRAY